MKEMGKGKYHIITFGCQMNEHDSETMAGMLQEMGFEAATGRDEADIILINTCSVRENADKRFFGTLGQLKRQKAVKKDLKVGLCGCMMQHEHIVRDIRRKYPWVDLVFGTHNIDELPGMLEELEENRSQQAEQEDTATGGKTDSSKQEDLDLAGMSRRDYNIAKHEIRSSKESRIIRVYEDRGDIAEGLPAKRLYGHKAFVNIMFGCNNFCSYCIVPYTRGREKSRKSEDILQEIKTLVDDGVREVTLLGQNVNSYRGDGPQVQDFTDLIYAINRIEGLDRIRFMTSHPKDLSDRLITAFGECGKLSGHIHLPVQAGSDRVLERMNRRYGRDAYMELVEKLRKVRPDIAITTDVIVGFPGEREEDFLQTLDLVEKVRYDSAFTFLYSPRKGTPAAGYEDQIEEEVKHERFDRLVALMNEISLEKNSALIGKTMDILVDGPAKKEGGTMMSGRSDGFKLVDFPGDESMTGKIVPVKIKDARTFSLSGELETQP